MGVVGHCEIDLFVFAVVYCLNAGQIDIALVEAAGADLLLNPIINPGFVLVLALRERRRQLLKPGLDLPIQWVDLARQIFNHFSVLALLHSIVDLVLDGTDVVEATGSEQV